MSLTNIQVELRRGDRQLQVEMPTPGGSTADLARNITNYSVKASFDPDNRSRLGSDGGIYTPELTTDPLAYYILAKA